MKKTITINGDNYTFKKFSQMYNGKNNIYQLYNNPSFYKVNAFNYWDKKLVEIYGLCGNSCTFSIHGYVKDEDGKMYNVRITRDNNYILDESN